MFIQKVATPDTVAENAASWKMFDRIVIVPDLHGDNKKFQDVLVGTQLAKWTMPEKNKSSAATEQDGSAKGGGATDEEEAAPQLNWIAKRTLMVQLGDMVDRGPDDKAVMDTMMRMQAQAPLHDSRAVAILGNHEIFQIQRLYHYAHKSAADAFGGPSQRTDAMAADGKYGKWLRALPVVVEAWDTVFVHAGLTRNVAKLGVQEINRLATRDIDINHRKDQPFIFEEDGPVWTRLMVSRASQGQCGIVDECLSALSHANPAEHRRRRIVVGHTPMRAGPNLMCDDRLLAADVGLSRWMYSGTSIVEMTRNETYPTEIIFSELLPEQEIAAEKERQKAKQEEAARDEAADKAKIENELKYDPTALDEIVQLLHEETKSTQQQQQQQKRDDRRTRSSDEDKRQQQEKPNADL